MAQSGSDLLKNYEEKEFKIYTEIQYEFSFCYCKQCK